MRPVSRPEMYGSGKGDIHNVRAICHQQQGSEIMEYTVECFSELFLRCTCAVDGI